jgi:hypothetical protein
VFLIVLDFENTKNGVLGSAMQSYLGRPACGATKQRQAGQSPFDLFSHNLKSSIGRGSARIDDGLEQSRRACAEMGQVARVMHNLGRVAITPLDLYRLPVGYVCLAQPRPLPVIVLNVGQQPLAPGNRNDSGCDTWD